MNASEGLRRIAAAVRWIGSGLAGLSLLFGAGVLVTQVVRSVTCTPITLWNGTPVACPPLWADPGVWDGGGALLIGIGVAAFFLYGARATAWIIEGFAAPRA